MKLSLALLIAVPLFITACKKEHVDNTIVCIMPAEENYGCIERVYIDKNDHIINSADIATVNKLFADNNIDNSNFRYTRYTHQVPPAVVADSKSVRVDQYAKGVRIITGDAIFGFTNDKLTYDTRTPIDVSVLDTVAHLPLQYVKLMFLKDIQKTPAFSQRNYVDSCLYAEFGFYQLSGNDKVPGKVVKAWRVMGKNACPVGIYKDDDGSSISFNDCIVF